MAGHLKRQGQRLYTLARQGIEVERQPRRVQIYRLTLLAFSAETLTVDGLPSADLTIPPWGFALTAGLGWNFL